MASITQIIRRYSLTLTVIAAVAVGFGIGWWSKAKQSSRSASDTSGLEVLRLGGYKYISPLLVCDNSSDDNSPELSHLTDKLQVLVNQEKEQKHIDGASVYFRDFSTANSVAINPDEKFFPASLSKIPVLIATYKNAQTNPALLQESLAIPSGTNTNDGVEIQPSSYLKPGNTYTVAQALQKMIKNSDNNAFYALSQKIDINTFKQTYQDLKIPLRDDPNSSPDYLTAKDFSYFLRVLYNATYLWKDYSEKALQILDGTDFTAGLVAGVPSNTSVSHKFGIKTDYTDGKVADRELHDCGIIYDKKQPYLLCVMTRSSGSLSSAEQSIKNISALVYGEVQNGYQ